MQTFWQDLRYGVRVLAKNPGFFAVAVITLTVGIGANTAIFSVVNAVLLQPLPFREPDRLVWMWGNIRNAGSTASVSPLDFLDYREQNKTFEEFAAAITVPVPFNLTGAGEPERLSAAVVTGNYFNALGVKPALGRTFQLEDEKPGHDQVLVLSYGLWRDRFGGDQSIVDKTVTLDGKTCEIIGVMPAGFSFPQTAQLWIPMNFDFSPEMKQRKGHFLRPVGRLKAGLTLAQAQADTDQIAQRLEELYPDSNTGWSLRLVPLREQIVGDIRSTLWILLGAVGFVLLIACANVANLLLARAASRQKEIAVRTALGAGRFRIIRQMITESLVLSLTGGALGALLAWWGVNVLVTLSAGALPSTAQVGVDASVLAFTLLISIIMGVMFGLAPALQTLKLNVSEALKEGGRGESEGAHRNRTRSILVVLESAIAVVLLIAAGLLIRSLLELRRVRPGFDPENVLTLRIDLARQKYAGPRKAANFFEDLESRIASLPGVEAAGMVSELPLSGQPNDMPFTVEGRPPVTIDQAFDADYRRVNQSYFSALRIPLLRGRGFTEDDVRQSAKVLLVSDLFARQVFPDEDAIGKRLIFAIGPKDPWEIIGIVGDVRHRSIEVGPMAAMYLPSRDIGRTNFVIRTKGNPISLVPLVRREVQAIDSDQPVAAVRTMDEWVYSAAATPRYRTALLGLFAAIALLLAAIGIYGVVSYTVSQRTHEVGVRVALGAQRSDVLKLIIGRGMALVAAGVGAGLVAGYALTRLMSTMLFGVSPTDPATFATVALSLLAVALLACYVPALRATRVDPMKALRFE